jgi:hypothetical protein
MRVSFRHAPRDARGGLCGLRNQEWVQAGGLISREASGADACVKLSGRERKFPEGLLPK